MKIKRLHYQDHIDCVSLLFQRKSDGSFAFQLWHPEKLIVLSEATISFSKIEKYYISDSFDRIVFQDDNSDINVVRISATCHDSCKKHPILFPKENSVSLFSHGNDEIVRKASLFFFVEQVIKYDSNESGTAISSHHLHHTNVTFIDLADEFTLFVYDISFVSVYTREKKVQRRAHKRKKINNDEDDTVQESNHTDFYRVRYVDMTHWLAPGENGTPHPPTCCRRLPDGEGGEHVCFAFTDGSIKVIRCSYLSEEEHKRNPLLLYEFVATPGSEITELVFVPWHTLHGTAYVAEFLTTGKDNVVCHWGLRQDMSSGVACIDKLGAIDMPIEPQSQLGGRLKSITSTAFVTPATTISDSSNLQKKLVICSYGGLVVFSDMIVPMSTRVVQGKTTMGIGMRPHCACYYTPAGTGTSMFADSAQAESIDSLDESHVPNGLLVMNDNALEVYSIDSGVEICRVVMPSANDGLYVDSQARVQDSISISSQDKGSPSAIHWCASRKMVVLGFTSGAVDVIDIQSNDIYALRSRRVHGAAIGCVQTALVGKGNMVVVIGDASGKISTFPAPHTEKLNELCQVDGHSSSLVSLQLVSTEAVGVRFDNDQASKYTLVSISKNTEVRVWTIGKDGKLYLASYFMGSKDLLSVTTVLYRSTVYLEGSTVVMGEEGAAPLQVPGAGKSLHDIDFNSSVEATNKRGKDVSLTLRKGFEVDAL